MVTKIFEFYPQILAFIIQGEMTIMLSIATHSSIWKLLRKKYVVVTYSERRQIEL